MKRDYESFEYGDARAAFREAQEEDSDFAMAATKLGHLEEAAELLTDIDSIRRRTEAGAVR